MLDVINRDTHRKKRNTFVFAFVASSLRHTCAIIMLSNQHLDMPHL